MLIYLGQLIGYDIESAVEGLITLDMHRELSECEGDKVETKS